MAAQPLVPCDLVWGLPSKLPDRKDHELKGPSECLVIKRAVTIYGKGQILRAIVSLVEGSKSRAWNRDNGSELRDSPGVRPSHSWSH